jgi:hypothetical protein
MTVKWLAEMNTDDGVSMDVAAKDSQILAALQDVS